MRMSLDVCISTCFQTRYLPSGVNRVGVGVCDAWWVQVEFKGDHTPWLPDQLRKQVGV